MLRYEVLILVTTEVTQDEAANLEKQVSGLVKNAQADLISYERWGKYRLAYPVAKKDYGVYYLVRFAVDNKNLQSLLAAMKELLAVKFNTIVLRFMMNQLSAKGSLEYTRPQSLEEMPQDVEAIIKDNSAMSARSVEAAEEVDNGQES